MEIFEYLHQMKYNVILYGDCLSLEQSKSIILLLQFGLFINHENECLKMFTHIK